MPRWFSYSGEQDEIGSPIGIKQSMTETYIPDFLKWGGKILSQTYAHCLQRKKNAWIIKATRTLQCGRTKQIKIHAETVFLAAGAIQTPALLQRSGLSRLAGSHFQLHPTIKIAAHFNETVNTHNANVAVHQVKEFSPRLSFGGSVSSLPHLALSLLDYPQELKTLAECWQNMAIYYAMITPVGTGKFVRYLVRAPVVTYKLDRIDYENLRDSLNKLAQILFSAGAIELFPSVTHIPKWTASSDYFSKKFHHHQMMLMTVHLFSSCPMGENKRYCVVNSFGKVHDQENLYITDGSTLPTALGVNPQGSIMAFARKSTLHFLQE